MLCERAALVRCYIGCGAGMGWAPVWLTPANACRFRLWFFPRKTRYSPAEALDFLRER